MRNGTRADSLAGEIVPTKVYTFTDDSFSPAGLFVLQTFYKDSRTSTPDREIRISKFCSECFLFVLVILYMKYKVLQLAIESANEPYFYIT